LEPVGEVKPETEIFRALAQKLGFMDDDLAAEIPGPDDENVRRWLNNRLAPFNLSLDDFREGPVSAPGGEDVVFADGVYNTPSGRIELLSAESLERWGTDPLPRPSLPRESAVQPDHDPATPLQMMTPNTKNRIHSQFGNLALIKAFDPEPEVQIHPDDAKVRQIEFGDRVRIHNQRGEVTVKARIDAGIRQGCVAVTNGWWGEQGGLVNKLSEGRETDMAHGAAFHDNLVEVTRA